MTHPVQFDPDTAYIAVYTQDTLHKLEQHIKGRPAYRYNIIARKHGLPDIVFLKDITYNQLQGLRSIAEDQGTKIW